MWEWRNEWNKVWIMTKWTANGIGVSGAIKISESLMMNTTLTELNLRRVIEEMNDKREK